MVDSWEGGGAAYDGDSGDWHAGLSQEQQDAYCEMARKAVGFAGARAIVIRARSDEAAKSIPDGSLDFVFIDADHSYEGCKRDIATWWPKVRAGGVVGGHDYENVDFPKFGVTQAVNEFAQGIGQTPSLGENFTWFLAR
jgi:predicted O-methyltransferase YrrM